MSFFRKLIKPRYQTLNRIEINAEQIRHNLDFLQARQPQAKLIPVLKSNAYGHGLKETCVILNKSGIEMIALDSFPEAQIAYRYFKGKVLLLGEMPAAAYRHLHWSRTEICVYSGDTLRTLAALNIKAKIHLFINTGMNREGIKDLPSFWEEYSDCWPKVEISGMCSHLADAEGDGTLNKEQLARFSAAYDFLHAQGCNPRWVHLGNSAGIFVLKDKRLTAFRPGLATYGYNPFPEDSPYHQEASGLKPALRVVSTVVSVQTLTAGETVSYNATYETERPTNVAVIPFGYYEGLDRRLSNLADFQLIKGKNRIRARLAGRVCMNLSCLDVGREAEVSPGDEIVLISTNTTDYNSVENLARLQGSIPYEVLVKLQANIRRKVV